MIDRNVYLSTCNGVAIESLVDRARVEHLTNHRRAAILVCMLDGADTFAERYGWEESSHKEELYKRVCARMVASQGGGLVRGRFHDAVIGVFDDPDAVCSALAAAIGVNRYLAEWNEEHQLGWEKQLHSRAGLSRSTLQATLVLARQAERKEIIMPDSEWNALSARERRLLKGAVSIRDGLSDDYWNLLGGDEWYASADGPETVNIVVGRAVDKLQRLSHLPAQPEHMAEERHAAAAVG